MGPTSGRVVPSSACTVALTSAKDCGVRTPAFVHKQMFGAITFEQPRWVSIKNTVRPGSYHTYVWSQKDSDGQVHGCTDVSVDDGTGLQARRPTSSGETLPPRGDAVTLAIADIEARKEKSAEPNRIMN
jgi:hypothetical protein